MDATKTTDHPTISEPHKDALGLLDRVIEAVDEPMVGEVGVGIGATSLPMARKLAGRGQIHFYDFADRLASLQEKLDAAEISNASYFPNSSITLDSYVWTLLHNWRRLQQGETRFVYDFVFFDGSHLMHHDAAATVLLKQMIKPGGILLLDDYSWSLAKSPTHNPEKRPDLLKHFTKEQIEVSHVAIICEIMLDQDDGFEVMDIGYRPGHERSRAYRRLN